MELSHGKLRHEVRTACLAGWTKKKLAELLADKYSKPDSSELTAEEYFLSEIDSHLVKISEALKLAKSIGKADLIRKAEETKKLCTFAGLGRWERKITPADKHEAKLQKLIIANDNANNGVERHTRMQDRGHDLRERHSEARMNDQIPFIEAFNSQPSDLSPDQVLGAFVKVLIQSRGSKDVNFSTVYLKAAGHDEKILVELDESPNQNVHPVQVHGVSTKGDEVVYLGANECVSRLMHGVRRITWRKAEKEHIGKCKEIIYEAAQTHKKQIQKMVRSFSEVERAVTGWYEDGLAGVRRTKNQAVQQQLRNELLQIEQSMPLMHRILSHLDQSPAWTKFACPLIVCFYCTDK
jgi:hypothetical protein